MKELACKPLLLAFLLSLPLWIVFGNYVVALIVALLTAFLISMCYSLYAIRRARRADKHSAPSSKTDGSE
jgi:ABC-type antimicrobial peptide transport system permease subunit